MSTQPLISVVIPTYQRCTLVRRALLALARQTLPADTFEVIVSVDGSTDGTREMLAALELPYVLHQVWQPNRGRAAACNLGIQAARGGVLVLLDDDMEPIPGFLAAHHEAHEQHGSRGVMGAVPIRVDAAATPVVRYVGAKFNRHLATLARPDHVFQLRDFFSGNFSIRRELLLQVGGFDEAFTVYGNEDLELSLRLKCAGVEFSYSARALAYQAYSKGFAALAHDNMSKGRTAVLLASKHPETFGSLKLAAYGQGPLSWRLLRSALIGLSTRVEGIPALVIALTTWLERRRPRLTHVYYGPTLDYLYWLGALSAVRENRRSGRGLISLARAKWSARP
jgi:GT2 family glycosyltransferase